LYRGSTFEKFTIVKELFVFLPLVFEFWFCVLSFSFPLLFVLGSFDTPQQRTNAFAQQAMR
jgi:hypothetical protein